MTARIMVGRNAGRGRPVWLRGKVVGWIVREPAGNGYVYAARLRLDGTFADGSRLAYRVLGKPGTTREAIKLFESHFGI